MIKKRDKQSKPKRVSFQQQNSEIGDEIEEYQNISFGQVSKNRKYSPDVAYQNKPIDFYNKNGRQSNHQYRFENNPQEVEQLISK